MVTLPDVSIRSQEFNSISVGSTAAFTIFACLAFAGKYKPKQNAVPVNPETLRKFLLDIVPEFVVADIGKILLNKITNQIIIHII
jgi:hypothetical protein